MMVAIALFVPGVIALPDAAAQNALDPAQRYRVAIDDAPRRGPDDAPITIVELSDFGCTYCGRAQRTLDDLMRLYPGRVRLVYRHNPLDPEEGTLAAEASMAAGDQGAFWAMHDRIFAAGGAVTRSQLEGFAIELGLDLARFRRDLDERRWRDRVLADSALARGLGALSTPVFFVNGRPINGARRLGVFVHVVEQELARASDLRARGVPARRLYDAVQATATQPRAGDPAGDVEEGDDDHGFAGLEVSELYRVGLGLPGHTIGPDDALVTVVVFTDFECPFCAKLAPILSAMHAGYPEDVRIAIRHLPLRMHPRAPLAAEAVAAAAAQGRMWDMHELILGRKGGIGRQELEQHAASLGLDMKKFRAALETRKYREAVAADAARAKALGVTGTPTMFINGTPVRGIAPYPMIDQKILRPKLEEARALIARGVTRRGVYGALLAGATAGDVGSRRRFPDTSGSIELDQDELDSALLRACQSRNEPTAQDVFDRLEMGNRRDHTRAACRIYGIELPATNHGHEAARDRGTSESNSHENTKLRR